MKSKRTLTAFSLCLLAYICMAQSGWTNQTPSSEYPGLFGIYAIDSEHVWAVGEMGTILHSTNGGESWQKVETEFEDSFNNLIFLNRDTGIVSGHPAEGDAFIIRTTDRGANWQRIQLNTSVTTEVNGMDFYYSTEKDSFTIFAVGGLGHAWKSNDCGETWEILSGGCRNGNFNACCMLDENTVCLVGTPDASYNFSIMFTTDGGQEFIEKTNPEKRKLNGVAFADANHGIAAGLASLLLATEDGGETWVLRTNSGYRWQDVVHTKTGHAWVVGSSGNIEYSNDYGDTWNVQESGVDHELWDVSFINDLEGWIVGGGIGKPGIILHTDTGGGEGGGTGLNQRHSTWLNLLEQNYPNPFKGSTRICYKVGSPGMITLSLYDVSGNLLQKLINEFQPEGSYMLEFRSEDYPPGIYFYDMKIDTERIHTKCMVIL